MSLHVKLYKKDDEPLGRWII